MPFCTWWKPAANGGCCPMIFRRMTPFGRFTAERYSPGNGKKQWIYWLKKPQTSRTKTAHSRWYTRKSAFDCSSCREYSRHKIGHKSSQKGFRKVSDHWKVLRRRWVSQIVWARCFWATWFERWYFKTHKAGVWNTPQKMGCGASFRLGQSFPQIV